MATIATITQPVTLTAVSTSTFGSPVKANVDMMMGVGTNVRPYCFCYLAGASSLTAGTNTTVALDTELEDSDSMHTGSNGFFTVVTAGVWMIDAQVSCPAAGTTGRSAVFICRTQTGGGSLTAIAMTDSVYTSATNLRCEAGVMLRLNVGDVITLQGFNTAGGTVVPSSGSGLNIQYNTWMSMLWMRA